jgi:hypothetical protein
MEDSKKDEVLKGHRRPWESPVLKTVGTVAEIVRGGVGKLSLTGGDPDEPRKQKPSG